MQKRLVFYVMTLVMLALLPAVVVAGGSSGRAAVTVQAPLNINRASAAQLIELPGVGKVTAEKIIAYRTEKGLFTSVEDLQKVKGIGPKKLERLRPLVVVH